MLALEEKLYKIELIFAPNFPPFNDGAYLFFILIKEFREII